MVMPDALGPGMRFVERALNQNRFWWSGSGERAYEMSFIPYSV